MTDIDASDPTTLSKRILKESSRNARRKWWAHWLSETTTGHEILHAVQERASRAGGFSLEEARSMSIKKMLRRGQGRSAEAQVRTNPIARDEAFQCEHCEFDVPAHGRTARNHCPECLYSKHVDDLPGDRRSGCGGLMEPIAIVRHRGAFAIAHRCRSCGFERKNRVLLDGSPPDNWKTVAELSTRQQA